MPERMSPCQQACPTKTNVPKYIRLVAEGDPETLEVSEKGVFAGGDFITGTSNVIEVIAHAHRASRTILKYLGEEIRPREEDAPKRIEESPWYSQDPERIFRQKTYGGWLRGGGSFREVDEGLSRDLALKEASRCLQCDFLLEIGEKGCTYCGTCVENCPQKALELVFLNKDPNRFKEHSDEEIWFSNGHWHIRGDARVARNPELCIQCGVCLRACPTKNICFLSYNY